METALIFAGGEPSKVELIGELPKPDMVIAANGGYEAAVDLGFAVDVLVGDIDSLKRTDLPDHVIIERHPAEKDATDLELALELVARETPDRVVVVGGSGGRMDHEIAIVGLLCSDRWGDIEVDWISARGWAHVVRERRLIHGDIGTTISLVAVGGDANGVTTKGLKWNLVGESLAHGTTRGVSNVMAGPVADIRLRSGCLLVMIPSE